MTDITLTFETGEVVGIAGPNGAGKSTLINLMLGFLNPSAGGVIIDGLRPRRFVERHGIVYVPEVVAIPPWWRVTGALARYAVLSGVPKSDRKARVEKAIPIADLQAQVSSQELLHYELDLASDSAVVTEAFPDAVRISEDDHSSTWTIDGDLDALNAGLRALLEQGATVRGFSPRRSRLESAFLDAVGES